jgi:hypothetical protein
MATCVRITKNPLDGRRYKIGERVTLVDARAAKLVASGCAELIGPPADSSMFSAMVDCYRKGAPKRAAAPPPKINVRLKAAGKVAGQLRNAGDVVAVDEGKAAMLVAEGLADIPSGVSARFADKVAEFRKLDAFLAKRMGGLQLATLFG